MQVQSESESPLLQCTEPPALHQLRPFCTAPAQSLLHSTCTASVLRHALELHIALEGLLRVVLVCSSNGLHHTERCDPGQVHSGTDSNLLHYSAMHCNLLKYSEMQCNFLQYLAMHCNLLQLPFMQCILLKYSATCCSLQSCCCAALHSLPLNSS